MIPGIQRQRDDPHPLPRSSVCFRCSELALPGRECLPKHRLQQAATGRWWHAVRRERK
jgi:hypothetical protein